MKKEWGYFLKASEIGFTIIFSILAAALVGNYLDQKLKTHFFIIVFLFLGIVGGFTAAYKTINKLK